MRKLTFAQVPPASEKLSDGRTRVHFNVVEKQEVIPGTTDPETGDKTEDKTVTVYECEFVIIGDELNVSNIVSALIRKKYSVNDELALLRQRDTKQEEFAQYNADAEAAKAIAHSIVDA